MIKEICRDEIAVNENKLGITHIEITVTYNNENVNRGYFMFVRPIQKESRSTYYVNTYVSTVAGDRLKLLSCARASKANEQKALDLAEFMKPQMINNVLKANNIELKK